MKKQQQDSSRINTKFLNKMLIDKYQVENDIDSVPVEIQMRKTYTNSRTVNVKNIPPGIELPGLHIQNGKDAKQSLDSITHKTRDIIQFDKRPYTRIQPQQSPKRSQNMQSSLRRKLNHSINYQTIKQPPIIKDQETVIQSIQTRKGPRNKDIRYQSLNLDYQAFQNYLNSEQQECLDEDEVVIQTKNSMTMRSSPIKSKLFDAKTISTRLEKRQTDFNLSTLVIEDGNQQQRPESISPQTFTQRLNKNPYKRGEVIQSPLGVGKNIGMINKQNTFNNVTNFKKRYFEQKVQNENLVSKIQMLELQIAKLNRDKETLTEQVDELRQKLFVDSSIQDSDAKRMYERKIFQMATELEEYENMLSEACKYHKSNISDKFALLQQIEKLNCEITNLTIRNDLLVSHQATKLKLFEDALSKRNKDIDVAEDNNRQLLSLLEKYDNKLDELQEDIEIKDLKIIEYEQNNGSLIKIESIEDKIRFLVKMLQKLREVHNHQSKARNQDSMLKDTEIVNSIDRFTHEIMQQMEQIERDQQQVEQVLQIKKLREIEAQSNKSKTLVQENSNLEVKIDQKHQLNFIDVMRHYTSNKF